MSENNSLSAPVISCHPPMHCPALDLTSFFFSLSYTGTDAIYDERMLEIEESKVRICVCECVMLQRKIQQQTV
jgi:hypothetical protein